MKGVSPDRKPDPENKAKLIDDYWTPGDIFFSSPSGAPPGWAPDVTQIRNKRLITLTNGVVSVAEQCGRIRAK
jgi:hypothetical protein